MPFSFKIKEHESEEGLQNKQNIWTTEIKEKVT
jgi:hypothetical protein